MKHVKIAFQTTSEGKKPPNGFQCVNHHMVFDIKMDDSQRKSWLVAFGHTTHTPDVITWSIVVTREIVCIALIIAVLHDLEVKAADVLDRFL